MNYKQMMKYYDFIYNQVRKKKNLKDNIYKLFSVYKDLNLPEVLKKIKSSNSPASDSYYIIHMGLTDLNEIEDVKNKYINSFVESAYKHTNKRKVSTKFTNSNKSRGYSG